MLVYYKELLNLDVVEHIAPDSVAAESAPDPKNAGCLCPCVEDSG